jgi:hypothetical protein
MSSYVKELLAMLAFIAAGVLVVLQVYGGFGNLPSTSLAA